MRHLSVVLIIGLGLGLFGLSGAALASIGEPLGLTLIADGPLSGGDVLTIVLSDGTPGHFAFLFVGLEEGESPFGELELDILPTGMVFLGLIPATGSIIVEAQMPAEIPPDLQEIYVQGASVGMDDQFIPDPPDLIWRKSHDEEIEFEDDPD